ncbi:MAG: hypothetical protein CTY25_07175 [Methylobacterium sp.]|nr:MAG: hypothetical protein CTY25_07175 [Methylobacterium sp.]
MCLIALGFSSGFQGSSGLAQGSGARCDNASLVAEPASVIPACMAALAEAGNEAKTRAGLLYILGRGYHRTARLAEAIESYDSALALDATSADMFVSRAWAAMEMHDVEGVHHFAQMAIRAEPSSARAWDFLGTVRLEMGDTIAALEAYEHALRIDPKFGLALLHRADVMKRLGKPERAVEDYEKILAMPPGEVETGNLIGKNGKVASFRAAALEGRATARWSSAPREVVEADLRAAIAMEPTPFRHRLLAQHFRRQPDRIEDAVRAMRASYEMAPYLVELQLLFGEYLLVAGKEEEGLAEIRSIISKTPGYMKAHSAMVIYFRMKNRLDEAIDALEVGYNANPDAYRWLIDRLISDGYWGDESRPTRTTPELKAAFRKCLSAKCA